MHARGSIEKSIQLNTSAPVPTPGKDQHLVKITATALNPVDYKPAEGIPFILRVLVARHATPVIDFSGRIVRPAAGSSLKEGDLVFGCCGTNPVAGSALREYSVSGAHITAKVPEKNVDMLEAATVGVAGLTAYQSIVPNVKSGDRVFINGGSGGVGCFGIQFAKAVGCHVTTTCSTRNVEFVRELGADEVVDYKNEKDVVAALKRLENFDHVVDNVGADFDLVWRSHEFLKEGKEMVVVGGGPSSRTLVDNVKRKLLPGFLGGLKRKVVGFWPEQKREDLEKIATLMNEGKVRAVIDEKFGFEEALKAIEKLKTGRARGKIVIEVAKEA